MDKKYIPQLGDTISRLGYGCMRFPTNEDGSMNYDEAEKLIRKGYEMGINYFDTAVVYHKGDSEKVLSRALKDYDRSTYYLADKMSLGVVNSEEEVHKLFYQQLDNFHTDYIDYYLVHALNRNNWKKAKEMKTVEFLQEMKRQGKIRHLGFSFHDTEPILKEIISEYDWDFTQIQLNYLDWKAMHADRLYQVLVDHNLPCMVMEPVRGGYLANLNETCNAKLNALDPNASIASWAVRFVSSLDNVAVVLSGMSSEEQLMDNCATFSAFNPLSEKELAVISDVTDEMLKLNDIPCTGCRYCMDCPKGVDIPAIFSIYAQWKVFGKAERFVNGYEGAINNGYSATNCVKCAQMIDIPNRLARVHQFYLEEKAKLDAAKADE